MTGFIVQGMVGRGLAGGDKAGVEFLIGRDAVRVMLGSKGAYKDGIGAVEGHHDVLVTAMGAGVEAASVVSEDVGEWDLVYGDRVGSHVQVIGLRWGRRVHTGTGGADVLSRLCHVPQVGLIGVGVVACH